VKPSPGRNVVPVTASATRPGEELTGIERSQQRLLAAIEGLTDGDARRATALPGWTVGHVLTHLARNADSHRRRTEAAVRGEVVDQYPGGYEGRDAEIEAGAARSAADLIDDVRVSSELMEAMWRVVPDSAWSNVTRDVAGRERPLRDLVARRWQEVEVHLVDLDIGVTYRDWPAEFVQVWLPKVRAFFPDRPETPESLDERDELAWLYGRLERDDLPVLPPWG
jgi:maleylpyruvate isomerase